MASPRPIDVRHLGRERVISAWQVDGVLVDPGPESTVGTLLDALGGERPRAVLLTHIHFDHAGAAGALVREFPGLEVWVHESGAPHLSRPERLVSSARRLYGEDFDRLWGEVVPVPQRSLRVLSGGERDVLGAFRVEYTPGHASHHVAYLHEPGGIAFTGDVCGVRVPPADVVIAPTPPPDIDLESWSASLEVVADWQPDALAITHFGRVDDPAAQIDGVRAWLEEVGPLARDLELDDFVAAVRARVTAEADDATAASILQAAPPDQLHMGLARYWHKRAEREGA